MVKIAPSILSADFSKLGEEIRKVEKYSDMLHFDVMDGHFVPNITYGPVVLEAVRRVTKLPIEADLMIENPANYIEAFRNAGADILTVHVEADRHIHRTLGRIKELGARAGISLNPSTPASEIDYLLDDVDLVLVMTVNPGFGGQKFIESMLPKVRQVKEMIKRRKVKVEIEVDGGINAATGQKAANSGADILVAGSYIYNSKDPVEAIKALKEMNL